MNTKWIQVKIPTNKKEIQKMGYLRGILFFCFLLNGSLFSVSVFSFSSAFPFSAFSFSSSSFSEMSGMFQREKPQEKRQMLAILKTETPKNNPIQSESPGSEFPLYQEAQSAMIQENYELAIQKFQQILELDPENASAYYWLGVCFLKLGDFQESQSALLKASEIDPELSFVQEKREYYRFLSEVRDALESLEVLTARDQKEQEIHKELLWNYVLFSILVFVLIAVPCTWIILKRKKIRKYKKHSISEELLSELNVLNQEFSRAKQVLKKKSESVKTPKIQRANSKKSKWSKMQTRLQEVEERCISLNERFEENRYGLIHLNTETFKDEIRITREMLSEILVIGKNKRKSQTKGSNAISKQQTISEP